MEPTDSAPTFEGPTPAPPELARTVVRRGEDLPDADRLRLLEELYGELESQLERDLDQAPSTRR